MRPLLLLLGVLASASALPVTPGRHHADSTLAMTDDFGA